MNLAPVIDYLAGELDEFAGRISAATDIEAALSKITPKTSPSLVLYGVREEAQGSTLVNAIRQRVDVEISVLTIVRQVSDMGGSAAYEALATHRGTVMDAMLGTPVELQTYGDDWLPVEFASGKIAFAEAGTLVWMDVFKTGYQVSFIP